MNYAFIDNNNVVVSVLYFETEPNDIDIFTQGQEVVTGISPLRPFKVTDEYANCGIGMVFTNDEFRPQQPYPSWLWDNTKKIWVAPQVHPELLYGAHGVSYEWDEDNQKWNRVVA
jgi:hypothetical protein